jgi:hypothetical protein
MDRDVGRQATVTHVLHIDCGCIATVGRVPATPDWCGAPWAATGEAIRVNAVANINEVENKRISTASSGEWLAAVSTGGGYSRTNELIACT